MFYDSIRYLGYKTGHFTDDSLKYRELVIEKFGGNNKVITGQQKFIESNGDCILEQELGSQLPFQIKNQP